MTKSRRRHTAPIVRCAASNKVRHRTSDAAALHLAQLLAHGVQAPGILHVYRCQACHDYHVGHRIHV